jgi:hypothetical protein
MSSVLTVLKGKNPLLLFCNRETTLNLFIEKIAKMSGYPSKLKSPKIGLLSDIRLYPVGRERTCIFVKSKEGEEKVVQISSGVLEL